MKWYWFCQCGARLFEANESETFCYINHFACGKGMRQAVKRQVFSLVERISARIRGENLVPKEAMSITQEQQSADFRRKYPELYAKERGAEYGGTGI